MLTAVEKNNITEVLNKETVPYMYIVYHVQT